MTKINSDTLIIRAAIADDIDRLLELSALVGSGMTSMPTDRQSWEDKLTRSIADFQRDEPEKNGDIYFMVLEDLNAGKIVGCCAVYAGIGIQRPFYSYKVAQITTSSEKLDLTIFTRVLNLVNDFTGTTEIGSLFLLPNYRVDGIGKFLSRSRFLLLADFPDRFDDVVFAEMRGWLDKDDNSPFWEHLGRKFFDLTFQEADYISATDGHQFISDLMPKFPVYLDLLAKEAQDVVGVPHEAAAGAFHILKKEGFSYSGYIDIFDAGPSIQTPLANIKTVADSKTMELSEIIDNEAVSNSDLYILSNSKLDNYKMMRAPVLLKDEGQAAISVAAAKALDLKVGDQLRLVK